MKILVINGPNINMLGIREPGIYGSDSFETLCNNVKTHAEKAGIEVKLFQSNHEGAYTHTSIALLDALKAVSIPTVEVHISDVASREDFRQISYIRRACVKTICGHGIAGYIEAIDYLIKEYGDKK